MRIDINVYLHPDGERVFRRLDELAALITNLRIDMARSFDEVLEKVREADTKLDSLDALVDGLRQQLKDVLSGTVIPPAVQAKVDAIFNTAQSNVAKIDAAIVENTPEEPTPPQP